MHYEPPNDRPVNRIAVKNEEDEPVFEFDIGQSWKVKSITWRNKDMFLICIERKELDEPQTDCAWK